VTSVDVCIVVLTVEGDAVGVIVEIVNIEESNVVFDDDEVADTGLNPVDMWLLEGVDVNTEFVADDVTEAVFSDTDVVDTELTCVTIWAVDVNNVEEVDVSVEFVDDEVYDTEVASVGVWAADVEFVDGEVGDSELTCVTK
jgi:hypothetical protein